MRPTITIRQMRYEDARRKFINELESAFINAVSEVEVLHGIGEYTLRNMVVAEVKKINYATDYSHPNPGVTIVELDIPSEGFYDRYVEKA